MSSEVQHNPLTGIFWMILAGILFVGVTALVKLLGTRLPAAESAFLRYLIGMVFFIPAIRLVRRAQLTRRQIGLFSLRGVAHTGAVALWFFAMARIPLADVTAMNYLSPIYVTIGAALFLGEKLALRRIMAVVAALIGALIILRPGLREVGAGHIAMLFTAMGFGVSYLVGKKVSDEVSPTVVVAMLSLTVSIGLAPLAIPVWVTPTLYEITILAGVAVLATLGHFVMSLGFRAAPVSVTQPATFLQLVWAVSLGAVVFGEAVDPYVILGGAFIVASISYISWREAVLKRRGVTPAPNAMK